VQARLRALAPVAVDRIEAKLDAGKELTEGEQRLLTQAWRVIEQVEGKPSQRQIVTGKIEIELVNDR